MNDLIEEIWDCATNAVCQEMQDRRMCKCPPNGCVAQSVFPGAYEAVALQRLQVERDEVVGLLQRVEPHIDAIVCYASTTGEHAPNKIVADIRATLSRTRGKEHG